MDRRQQEVDIDVAVAAATNDGAAAARRHGAEDLVGGQVGAVAVVAAVGQLPGLALKLVTSHLLISEG